MKKMHLKWLLACLAMTLLFFACPGPDSTPNGSSNDDVLADGIWETVGVAGISEYSAFNPRIAATDEGFVYALYDNVSTDESAFSTTTVWHHSGIAAIKKYDGKNWESIADIDWKGGDLEQLEVGVDNMGSPWLLCTVYNYGYLLPYTTTLWNCRFRCMIATYSGA